MHTKPSALNTERTTLSAMGHLAVPMRMALLIALCEPSTMLLCGCSPAWQTRSSACKPLRPVPHARARLLIASSAVPPGAKPPASQSKEPPPAAPAGRYVSTPMSRWLLVLMVFVSLLEP